jgi:hypothetical protein
LKIWIQGLFHHLRIPRGAWTRLASELQNSFGTQAQHRAAPHRTAQHRTALHRASVCEWPADIILTTRHAQAPPNRPCRQSTPPHSLTYSVPPSLSPSLWMNEQPSVLQSKCNSCQEAPAQPARPSPTHAPPAVPADGPSSVASGPCSAGSKRRRSPPLSSATTATA